MKLTRVYALINHNRLNSSVGRALIASAGGFGFKSWLHLTKRCKNGTSNSLADAILKGEDRVGQVDMC